MNVKKILKLLVIFCLAIVQTAFAQNINLTFTGSTTDGKYVRMDSVRIENISRSWTETLVYPDTMLTLTVETSVNELEINSLKFISYPNPCNGRTNVFLTLAQEEIVTMQVYNLAGQIIMEKNVKTEAGKNHFEISLNQPQTCFFVVQTSQGKFVQKLVNIGNSGNNSIVYIGVQGVIPDKTQKLLSSKPFHKGDELKMTGYLSPINAKIFTKSQSQIVNENLNVVFVFPLNSLPTLKTSDVTNVTDSSAVSGGYILTEGTTPIIACGVCWSTSSNPTINDNHTVNNYDYNFRSYMSNLTPRTTYYVRAYATNAAGTEYGNELMFTTEALPRTFSVSDTTQVIFSPGNLQWSATSGGNAATTHVVAGNGTAAGTWRFAPNQWDTIGADNRNISATYTGWIDLFGWGTSGYNNKYPYMTSTTYSDYGNGNNNISGTNYDWGVYNAIYNPQTKITEAPGTWRTLTKNEWDYLLYGRSTSSGINYAKGIVRGICGLILVPDNWKESIYSLSSTNGSLSASYTANIITNGDWSKMEAAGCVFLPAGGRRYGISVSSVGSYGEYWSATNINIGGGYILTIASSWIDITSGISYTDGASVRLVKDVK